MQQFKIVQLEARIAPSAWCGARHDDDHGDHGDHDHGDHGDHDHGDCDH